MRRIVMIACALLLFVPVYIKSRTSQDIPACAAFSALSSGRISVKVSGDVRYSGIYEVPANSLAFSVINMSVPLRPFKRDKADVNAVSPLYNGAAIKLVGLPEGSHIVVFESMTVPECLVLKIPLDIAAMSEADFDRLTGIGPALAKRIVEYRQNNGGILRVEDLVAIEGIGDKKYMMMKSYFQGAVNTHLKK